MEGLEPTHLTAPDPKSGASTNFATSAESAKIAKRRKEERGVRPGGMRSHDNSGESFSFYKNVDDTGKSTW